MSTESRGPEGGALGVPRDVLAGEIEFAIAYTVACNPGRDLLGADRKLFAEAIADMLFERAGAGLSRMLIVSRPL